MSTSNPKPARPHRRLSLTLPTEVAPPEPPPAAQESRVEPPTPQVDPTQPGPEPDPVTIRVMSYLTEAEAQTLDDLWLHFRRTPQRPSKSDLMRAALTLAANNREGLLDVITNQQDSTLARQRSSKISGRRG